MVFSPKAHLSHANSLSVSLSFLQEHLKPDSSAVCNSHSGFISATEVNKCGRTQAGRLCHPHLQSQFQQHQVHQCFSQTGDWERQDVSFNTSSDSSRVPSICCRDGETAFRTSPSFKLPCVSPQVRGSTPVTTAEHRASVLFPVEAALSAEPGQRKDCDVNLRGTEEKERICRRGFPWRKKPCVFLKEKLTLSTICQGSSSRYSGTPVWEVTAIRFAISKDKGGCS